MNQPFHKVESIASSSEQLLTSQNPLTEVEKHQILVEWNKTQTDYPKDKCIHQLFEEQVERSPDSVAVVFENEQLTYRELNQRANQLAHYLQTLGVSSEVLVGICVERSLEMIVGILGILKAGGAYVPLDLAYPQERLAFMLQDAAVSVLLSQSQLAQKLPVHSARLVYLDKDEKAIDQQSQKNLKQNVKADNLAYVIYTSGSTGNPKGVCCKHIGVVNLLVDFQNRKPISVGARCSLWTVISFDVSVYEIFAPLLNGGTLLIPPDHSRLDSKAFLDWLSISQIFSAYIPPFMLSELVTWLNQSSAKMSLQRLLVGVEPLEEQLLLEVVREIPEIFIINGYGPTEATICATLYSVKSQVESYRNTPIGKPVQNTQVYILDRHLQPVPVGVSGELYIGGDGLARGYLNRPDLTQEKFIPNPFSNEPGARLYKTGDLARYLPDGNIEFLGRIDHQVKIRGYRIELGEIETALSQYPDVQHAVVVVRENMPGDKRLVAYFVTQHTTVASHKLHEFLQRRLPEYMMPNAFVHLDALPLTPNGKVDRRALPAPEKTRSELKASFVAPRNPIETALAEIWAKVLELDQVGIDDEFLELGGHSLLAIQIVSRITDTLNVELSIASLFSTLTIADLAKQIEANRQNQSLLAPAIQPVAKDQPLSLSYAQERLWFLAQLEPSIPVYNEPFTIRFPDAIDIDALEQAISKMIGRHDSLRTRFITVEGQPFQIIDLPSPFHLRVVDLRQLPLEQREPEALQIATLEAKQPFNLATERLLRATLIQLADDDYRLFVTMHHIIIDGISLFNVFLPELAALYEAIVQDQPSPLADLPTQYADFAVWQRQWLQGEALLHHLDYWKQQLGGELPTLQLPTDHSRLVNRSFQGARQCLALSKSLTEALRALSQQEGVTLYMVLLAAFNALLYRYTGQDDVVIGTVSAGRNKSEIENAIGFFLKTLVLRTDLSGFPSFRQLLTRVREVSLDACTHEDLPFEQLVEALQLDRNLNHNPLFQVAFVLEPPIPSLSCGWTVSQLDIQTDTAKFDLTLELDERPEGIIGRFEYNTDLFDDETIARMVGHFQTLLKSIVANPEQRITELPLLTEPERHQLLVEWNNTKTEYLQNKCIYQLFEEQVERSPDAIAVVFENEHLTYQELNARANRLAHYLQTLGVNPEVLVGICVERSLEMIIGILGILKAGGAYVPLDPAYPSERLAFILEDAAVAVLLTQSQLAQRLPAYSTQRVYLDQDWKDIAQQSQENLTQHMKVDNLAYVIYTSGSTGTPKGVLVEHQGVVNLVCWHQEAFAISPTDRTTQLAGFAFDASVWEIWSCLTAGASLYIANEQIRLSPLQLQAWLIANNITVSFLPTALAETILPLDWARDVALRVLLTGGDKLQCYPTSSIPFKVVNNYGPTENTVVTTSGLVPANGHADASPCIGKTIANTQLYILDRHLQTVPVGVPGELHIGGDGLARGYLNRPDLTQERFIPNPFSNEAGSRLYKTGDLARYLPDGNIEFLGRIDHQVKIRGFRIELGEIETALTQHPDVREAVVTVREDMPGDKRLAAYITSHLMPNRLPYQSECLLELDGNTLKLRTEDISNGGIGLIEAPAMAENTSVRLHLLLPGANEAQWFNGTVAWSRSSSAGIQLHLTPTEQSLFDQSITHFLKTQGLWKTWQRTIAQSLRQYLKGKLPNYMVPSAFVLMQTLPLTPNGKIDRRALPHPQITRQKSEEVCGEPQTPEEKILIQVWSDVLHVNNIGVHDNFFELGGDSIRSMQIISRASTAGIQITLKQIFQYQTIAELAAAVGSKRSVLAEQEVITGAVPLTPIQQWLFEQNSPDVHHFNQAFLLEVRRAIDPHLLQQSLEQLLIHHDALRLQFIQTGVGWQQVNLSPNGTVPFSVVNLSNLSVTEQETEIETQATTLQSSLDLSAGSLAQFVLFDLGIERSPRLLMIVHHLAIDGVSWRILLEDLQTVYQQLEANCPIQLPLKTTSFKFWAERLVDYTRSHIHEQKLEHWLKLAGASTASLPLDFEFQTNTVASSQTITVSLTAEETSALLKQVPKTYQTQINDVLLASLVQVLALWCGSRQILIDLEGHGREEILAEVDLSRTVGWFTSIFPVLLKHSETDDLGESLVSIKEQLRSIPNRGISYGLLRYMSGDTKVTSSLRLLPQAEICFNYLGQFDWGVQSDDLFKLASESIGSTQSLERRRTHLIEINALVVEGQLKIEWTYSTKLHRTDTIERLAQDYVERLRSLITHCLETRTQQSFPEKPAVILPPVVPVPKNIPIQLSFCQYDFWQYECYLQEISSSNSAANATLNLRVRGALSIHILEQSINEIVRRHEILRTTFTIVDDQPRQVTLSSFDLPLEIIDLEAYPAIERTVEAEGLIEQVGHYKFNLTSDIPAIQARLLKLSSEEHWLSIAMHHILTDRWSLSIFYRELELLYNAFSNNLPSPLSDLPIQYADFAYWQNQWLPKSVLPNQLAYWQQKLSNLPEQLSFLPTQLIHQPQMEESQSSYSLELSTELATAIKQLSSTEGFTIFTIIVTALNILLFCYSGYQDILLLATTTNRKEIDLEKLIGCFINDVILRAQIDDSQTGMALLLQISKTVNESLANQDIPLTQVVEIYNELDSLRTISISMAPSVRQPEHSSIFELLSLGKHELFNDDIIELYVGADAETIEFTAFYCTNAFTKQSIKEFFDDYQRILHKLVQRHYLTVSAILDSD
jgi:surfactin family lipopeptide synthetase A